MKKLSKCVGLLLLFSLFLIGCGIDFSGEPTATPTPLPPTATPAPDWLDVIPMPQAEDPDLVHTIPDLISEVETHLSEGRIPEAIATVDQVIDILPDYADAYAARAAIYAFWANSATDLQTARLYSQQAKEDIETAIDIGPEAADYHYMAYAYIKTFGLISEENYLDQLPYYNQALEHLLLAIELGTTVEQANHVFGTELSGVYRCREAFDYLDRLVSRQGMTASEFGGIDLGLSVAHLCLGNLDNAQDHMLKVVEIVPSQYSYLFLAQIYYQAGEYEKALETLDNSYATNGEFGGWRFYLRAAVQYALGETELALEDIALGDEESWIENQLRAYVLGRIALDAGNEEEGLAYLEASQKTINPADYPKVLEDIDEIFTEYGHEVSYVLPAQGLFEDYPAYTDDEMKLPEPPDGTVAPIYVTYKGSGYIFPFGESYQEYQHTIVFTHAKTVDLAEISEVNLILQGYFVKTGGQEGELGLTFTLYNHASGEWDEIPGLGFGRNPQLFAEEYVSEEGFVYLNVEPVAGQPAVLLSNVALEVTGVDSADGPVYLGFGLGED
jgi:tetratricopeptide (TPR) repeat protein